MLNWVIIIAIEGQLKNYTIALYGKILSRQKMYCDE
jgi:hypothetical protein